MVNIDNLVNEWAYRCKKGYPDMDSPSDLRLLKVILKEQGISLSENLSAAREAPNTSQIDTKKEFFHLLDNEDLSPKNIEQLSALAIRLDPTHQLDEDEEDFTNKLVSNKEDYKDQIDQLELSEDQLAELSARATSFKYEDLVRNYFLKEGGKAMVQDQVFGVLWDSMVKSGDVLKFVKYIESPESFKSLFPSKQGNLQTSLKGVFKDEFINKMITLDGAYGGISIGKGEFFLTLVCADISFEGESEGDLDWGGKGLEIKNKGAKPTGQKSVYGPNSHDLMFKNLFKFFNGLISKYNPDPIEFGNQRSKKKFISIKDLRGFKGFMNIANEKWPYKLKTFYNLLSKDLFKGENDKLKDEFITIFKDSFKESYKGLGNVPVMDVEQYFESGEFEADRFTLDWGIAVVQDYMKDSAFDFVLFLNDKTFKYHLFSKDEVIEKLTLDKEKESHIVISPQDGLPRWSATSTLF